MERSKSTLIATLAVLLILTCSCVRRRYNTPDIAAAKAELDSLYVHWSQSWCESDLEAYLAPIDKDAVFLGWPTEKLLAGKPLIEQAVRQRFLRSGKNTMHPTFHRDRWLLHATPTIAWAEAGITLSYTSSQGTHHLHYLESMVFERRNGAWQVVQFQRSAGSEQ